ncbi:MAG TPA: T9SS type A sorting domain-containing protein [Bacteroidia bacterium]|nr:T9SS type A sorting domain-containing protein [Bacteroidia bacterium]
MRARQKTTTSFKTKLIIGTSCCLLMAAGIFVSINISNVNETMAAIQGDYRSQANGNWEEAFVWEMYDGKKWQPATAPPVNIEKRIFIKSGTIIKANSEITVSEITVEKEGTLQLNSQSFHIKKQGTPGEINVYGILDAGNCIIDGDGAFNLKDNAEIMIGSQDGLSKSNSGNVRVTGTRYYSSIAHYTFKGTAFQHTGKGLPYSVSVLTVDNPAGVELENNLYVTSLLHLKKGTLNTGADTLIVGTGKTSNASVKRDNGGVAGNFKRWLNKSTMKEALFPLMESSNYNAVFMTVKPGDYSGGAFSFSFVSEKIKKNEQPVNNNTRIIAIGETGYYKLTASDGFENGLYKLVTSIAVSKNENKSYWMMSAKPVDEEEKKEQQITEASDELVSNIRIAPNPFKEKFTLKFDLAQETEVEINLLNANGQLIIKDRINGKVAENKYEYFDKRNLPRGSYILRLITGDKIETRKIIKQ